MNKWTLHNRCPLNSLCRHTHPVVALILQVRLQRPGADRLLRGPSAVRRLPDLRWWCPGHAALLRLLAPGHRSSPPESRLFLLRSASLGSPFASISSSHRPAHPSSHDQVRDGRGSGRVVSSRLPGEIGAHHLQTRGPADKDRHAKEALPSVGRSLRRQAPEEDYKHPAVHHAGRSGHPIPRRTLNVRTVAVRVLLLTHKEHHKKTRGC